MISEDSLKESILALTEHTQARRPPEPPLAARIGAAPEAEHAELARLHRLLREVAERAQDYNAVNGKIVRRSQESVRELIHPISGPDGALLYGEQGQTRAAAQGTAIASA